MGYMRYSGRLHFKDRKQLTDSQIRYLRLFAAYCHCNVREDLAEQAEDPIRVANGLPLGPNCCYFLDSGWFPLMPEEKQLDTLIRGRYRSQEPLAASCSGGHKTLPDCNCRWTASVDACGIEWEQISDKVCDGKMVVEYDDSDQVSNAVFCQVLAPLRESLSEPCTTASQLDKHVEWLQFLVRPLLLEQWGLEAEGEIWYQDEWMLDTGRIYIDSEAAVVREDTRDMQNILGFAVNGDVEAMHQVFEDQGSMALKHKEFDAAVWLLQQPGGARLEVFADQGFWEFDDCFPGHWKEGGRSSGLYLLAKLWPEGRDFSPFVSLLPNDLLQELICTSNAGGPPLCVAVEQGNVPLVRWLLQNGADPMWAGSYPGAREEDGRADDHPMAYPLHRACMKDAGAELVDALVCAGAQLESRAVWRGTGWRTQRWEGTPLFKAACVARYDSVQELVWQAASLKAPSNCMMERGQKYLREEISGPPPHDAELAAVLHPSTYRLLQDLDGHEAEAEVYGIRRMYGTKPWNLMPTCALLSFKSAAQAGLERRRLLVLAVLSVQPGPHLPAGLLQHVCMLAELVL